MSATQADQAKKWQALRAEILARIKEIDDSTPWSECEPTWWLTMRSVQREVMNASLTCSQKKEGG